MTNSAQDVISKYGKSGAKSAPKAPENLQKEGKRLWKAVWDSAADLLKDSDFMAIQRLCVLADREYGLQNELTVMGKSWYRMNKVTLAEHPVSKMLTEVRRDMLNIMKECGLTPSSRARIQIETNGFEEIMQALITASGRQSNITEMERFE